MKKLLLSQLLLLLVIISQAQADYRIVQTFHIAGAGGWDYIAVNGKELYVSHGTQVNILNKTTGDSVGIIPNTIGVHGIAFDNIIGKGFTSNGRLNNVYVFDLGNKKLLDSISTGKNPDAILFEPFTKTIITCNGRSNDLSVIDPIKDTVIATISVTGKPETAVSDGKGRLYVNIEDKNEIAVINLHDMQLLTTWPLDGAEGPTGLCYDPFSKRLFAGCEKELAVLDAVSGKVVTKISIGRGCDGVAFDLVKKTIFTSNGQDGTMTIIKEVTADEYKVMATLDTKRSARTIAIDESTHTIYLPAAELEPAIAGQRPKMIPGTFQVLVIR